MAESRIEIRVTASGAEQAQKILAGVAREGGQIGPITAGGAAQAQKALGSLSGNIQNVSGLMAQAGVNTGIFGQALGALSGPFGIASAGAVALGLAIKSTTDYMVQNYQQLRTLIAVSGLAADEADALADTFDLLGLNADALKNGLFKMSTEIDAGGAKFRALGVEIRDSAGHLKAEGELFLELRDRISQMGAASERNAALMQVFGRSGRELVEVFALSESEFRKWLDTAGKMGPSAAESMRVTKEYTLAANALSKEWQGFVEVAGQRLLPILTQIVGAMNEAVKATASWGQSVGTWLDELATKWNNYKAAAFAGAANQGVPMLSVREMQ